MGGDDAACAEYLAMSRVTLDISPPGFLPFGSRLDMEPENPASISRPIK
jgi:hypothetical protein